MRAAAFALLVATILAPPAWSQTAPADIQGHWAESRIELLLQRNIAGLFTDQTFRPDQTITRGEFVKWLVLARGLPVVVTVRTSSFSDVPITHPLSRYIEAALASGWIARTLTFLPLAGIGRVEAVALAVQAIGYGFESVAVNQRPLPFDDVDGLSDAERGAIAVAVLSQPPLLREPPSTQLRPFAAMTRGEAASLVWASLMAAEEGMDLRVTSPVAAGVDLVVEKRGVLRTQPVWRVQVGAFAREDNAQRLAAAMRDRGLPVVVDLEDGLYKVRVGSFASAADAVLVKDQLTADGYPTSMIATLRDVESLPGPFRIAALIVDPRADVRLVPGAGDGQRMRRQKVSDLVRRTGALGAVNGGFFSTAGDPLGCLMIDRQILREPDPQHTCAGITGDGAVVFDRARLNATITAGAQSARIEGVNRERGPDELILYYPTYDLSTRTNQFGTEAAISSGVVTSVADLEGNTAIPRDGFVLSGHGRARQWILQYLRPGTPVTLAAVFVSDSDSGRWTQVVHAIGGGPRLLAAGQFVGGEGFPRSFVERRHPRSAIGVLRDGRVILFVVDGRHPLHSVGMTLLELAMELRRIGAVDAMNLDGGGSATLVAAGRVINLPSDETGERPVGDALLVLPATPAP